MTEADATPEQKAAASNALTNIATLIRNGFFPGAHAIHVKDAIAFLDQMAAIGKPELKLAEEPEA